jgi:hypothetical protein
MRMKLLARLGLLLSLVFVFQSGFSQEDQIKKRILINGGLAAGYSYGVAHGSPITGSVQFGISRFWTIGPYYARTHTNYEYYGYSKVTFDDFGIRAAYHFGEKFLSNDRIDVYGGLGVGFVTYSGVTEPDPFEPGVRGSLFVGARWYFIKWLGVNAEVGISYVPAMAGLTVRL